MVYVNVAIDVDEFLDQCDGEDIQEVIEYIKDGYSELLKDKTQPKENLGNLEIEYQQKFNELVEHVYKFTDEEQRFLRTMFRKYL